jgi:Fe-S cluster biogenesis protein NfuA
MNEGQGFVSPEERIEGLMDQTVRPYLKLHNGDIRIHSFVDGVLKVQMLGGCSNCPSAVYEIEQMVAESVMGAVPQVRSVTVETGVSDALLEEARAFLRRS